VEAAGEVRKRWLTGHMFPRRTAPREVVEFVAWQLLTMPDPLRSGLAAAHSRSCSDAWAVPSASREVVTFAAATL
jgi:hypothetical protein